MEDVPWSEASSFSSLIDAPGDMSCATHSYPLLTSSRSWTRCRKIAPDRLRRRDADACLASKNCMAACSQHSYSVSFSSPETVWIIRTHGAANSSWPDISCIADVRKIRVSGYSTEHVRIWLRRWTESESCDSQRENPKRRGMHDISTGRSVRGSRIGVVFVLG